MNLISRKISLSQNKLNLAELCWDPPKTKLRLRLEKQQQQKQQNKTR